jgi:hypothetical protein
MTGSKKSLSGRFAGEWRQASLAVVVVISAGMAAACSPTVTLRHGDPNSAEVADGGDLAAATGIARLHCAQFERDARYLYRDIDLSYFACDRR